MSNLADKLVEIIEQYEDNRKAFSNTYSRGSLKKNSLLEYQTKFVSLKADLRPYMAEVTKKNTRYDDKSATAIKFRIAIAIHEGEYKDKEGELIYEACSINQAEKFASGSKDYKAFINKRAFYKESYVNLRDIREDINSYINLIKDLIKQ
jgi:hypothetical protein